jgi:hypothetical protein
VPPLVVVLKKTVSPTLTPVSAPGPLSLIEIRVVLVTLYVFVVEAAVVMAVAAIVTLSVPTAVTLPVSGATKLGRAFLVPGAVLEGAGAELDTAAVTAEGVVALLEDADAPSVLARMPPTTAPPVIRAMAVVVPRRAFGAPTTSSSATGSPARGVGPKGELMCADLPRLDCCLGLPIGRPRMKRASAVNLGNS